MNVSIIPRLPKVSLAFSSAMGALAPLMCLALPALFTNVAVAIESSESTCPFCSAASQTLRQEILSMDAVAIGKLVADGRAEIDGNAEFKIENVLRGEPIIKNNETIGASYFGPGKSAKKFLLLGVDPRALVWSSPLPLSPDAEKYVQALLKLPDDPIKRLEFYQDYFEHADPLLARDAYDEFGLAPYADVRKLKDRMNRKQLLTWIQDPSKSPDRKRLYFTMLAICGNAEDAKLLESMIRSEDSEKRAGLDALIAAYLTLRGPEGLPLVEEMFLDNSKSPYTDIYAAVMALRFHGTELDVLPKDAVIAAMHHLLKRPDLADLVIPDLARWGDWSQIDRLTELFKDANDDNSWVRVPVVNYLRACPLPEAKAKIKELEAIDPKAVQRAATFFPIPTPSTPKKNDSSSLQIDKYRAPMGEPNHQSRWNSLAFAAAVQPNSKLANAAVLRGFDTPVLVRNMEKTSIASSIWDVGVTEPSTAPVNLWAPLLVTLIGAAMLLMTMWVVATSGGSTRWLVPATQTVRRIW